MENIAPLSHGCRARLLKQNPLKPTQPRVASSGDAKIPGPQEYDIPDLFGGKGFGKIKRAPAYTFGLRTPYNVIKPVARPHAPMFNIHGMGKKGIYKVPGGVVGERLEPMEDRTLKPGPAAYLPRYKLFLKRAPAYGCRLAQPPPYQAWDMWTPPPNMYLPHIPGKKAPGYTLGYAVREHRPSDLPGPGEHDPKFNYPKHSGPSFSFGRQFKPQPPPISPPANYYCERKFLVTKRRAPAPSFGIRHSPYLGKQTEFLKPEDLDVVPKDGS